MPHSPQQDMRPDMRSDMRRTIDRFRGFNRFYTRVLGLLDRSLLGGPLSLAQARVLYELAARPGISAVDLCAELGMDKGQLSRIVARLDTLELLERQGAPGGKRRVPLVPTPKGLALLQDIEAAADGQALELLGALDTPGQTELCQALGTVRRVLEQGEGASALSSAPQPRIRLARSGDLGWIAMRHARVYGREYGFSQEFEGYVLLGLAEYLEQNEPRSRVWIAELDGRAVGSVGLVHRQQGPDKGHDDKAQAQLRWLLVEPEARGLGLGRELVRTALEFSAACGHTGVYLWTLQTLPVARKLYASLGFTLAEEKQGSMGGKAMVEERWELAQPR